MVNTGTTTTATLASDKPEISISFNTFTNQDIDAATNQPMGVGSRFVNVIVNITGVKITLAVATFERLFGYIQNSIINDVNPMAGLNTIPIINIIGAFGTRPETNCIIQVDKTSLIDTVTCQLSANNLRIDYMDEYFARTLTYLTEALQGDLNPDE